MPPPGKIQNLPVILRGISVCAYPLAAYDFVQQGLAYTVQRVHGPHKKPSTALHVTGQQLCHGLRELALWQWGLLARTVLQRWNITTTMDFGRIVFHLADQHVMATTPTDSIHDFDNVYDFATALEADYRIPLP